MKGVRGFLLKRENLLKKGTDWKMGDLLMKRIDEFYSSVESELKKIKIT